MKKTSPQGRGSNQTYEKNAILFIIFSKCRANKLLLQKQYYNYLKINNELPFLKYFLWYLLKKILCK